MFADLRLAARRLLAAKGFTLAAVLTLALAIAGTTAMFALVEGVLLRPLPVRDQERLVVMWKALDTSGAEHLPFRAPEIDTLRRVSRTLESVAAVSHNAPWREVAVENEVANYLQWAAVGGDFFRVLGVDPLLGRALTRSDDTDAAEKVLVISYGIWQRRYGGARDVVGRRLTVNEHQFTIVGVMPPDVEHPRGSDAWMTMAAATAIANPIFRDAVAAEVNVVGRLRPGVTIEQAASEMRGLVLRFDADAPVGAIKNLVPVLKPYVDVVVGDVRTSMLALFGAVALVLLIATANVANLLLMRGEARRVETAVRGALGASRARLARQMMAESLVLAVAAGGAGLAVTWWSLQVLVRLLPEETPRLDAVRLDAMVILFAVGIAFITATLVGVAPAIWSTGIDLADQLRSGGRGPAGQGTRRGRRALVVAQVAIAVTVVTAAALLTRSLVRLQNVDMGLAADQLMFVPLSLPKGKYDNRERQLQLLNNLVTTLEGAPNVAAATPVNAAPFDGVGWDVPKFTIEGQNADEIARNPSLNLVAVHPNYFRTFGMVLVRGRAFGPTDRDGTPDVAIVSADVADRAWPGQDPIGKRLKMGGGDSNDSWRTVVGVVRPTRYRDLRSLRPTLYVPAEQLIVSADALVIRTSAAAGAIAGVVRDRIRQIDPEIRAVRVTPFRDLLDVPLARPRFTAALIGVFGVTALLLAAIGLYAVMAAYVRHRYAEIGVRVALGASARDVRSLVLGEGLRLTAIGTAIGLATSIASTQAIRGLLFGVGPYDPASLLAAALLLIAVSAMACDLPARRAARLDPIETLRAI